MPVNFKVIPLSYWKVHETERSDSRFHFDPLHWCHFLPPSVSTKLVVAAASLCRRHCRGQLICHCWSSWPLSASHFTLTLEAFCLCRRAVNNSVCKTKTAETCSVLFFWIIEFLGAFLILKT